jgi:protein involved in polysaccharide export with SLBB domain
VSIYGSETVLGAIPRAITPARNVLFFSLILVLASPAARAQRTQSDPAGPSDLAQENLGRVAASASQIGAALQKDPGLIVELKRWVAKEATDHGQVLSDSDLTDQAIHDRLASDLEFRSIATRLLQRYGYLLPQPSPGSEAAPKAVAAESSDVTPRQKSAPARPIPPPPGQGPLGPSIERPPVVVPAPAQKLLQASGRAGAGVALPAAEPSVSWSQSEEASRREHAALTAELSERAAPPAAAAATSKGMEQSSTGSGSAGVDGRPAIVHRPNPYADIPSFYDMYRQVSANPPELARFGMDVFRNGAPESDQLPMDLPVGPDYVVGPGDGLAIDLWGSVSQRLYRIVDREGRLALPEAGPVLVSGRTLGEVQQAVQRILGTQFRDISADVSLSRLRSVRVYVVGDVERPGAYAIRSLSTPLNALFYAGGPTSNGSLRILRHYRGKELVQDVDVYDLLLHGVKSGMQRLESGDTVLVPPIGAQITVEGMVRRPAIYELRAEKTLADMLELAGGILPSATLRHIEFQRLVAHEKRTMLSLDVSDVQDPEAVRRQLESFAIQNGDDVRIFPVAPYNQDAVYLEGHVLRPGKYSYRPGMKLTDLVSSYKDLLPEPAAKYAEIIRLSPPDYHPSVESFDLAAALANPSAVPALKPLDTVRIFGRYDFESPPTVSVEGAVREPGTFRTAGQIHLSDAIHLAGGLIPDALMENAQIFRYLPDSRLKILSANLKEALADSPLDNILLQSRDRILVHLNPAKVDPPVVSITGEVVEPGRYALTTNLTVGDLIRIAGGLKRSADTETADLTRYLVGDKKQKVGKHEEIDIGSALESDPAHAIPLHDGDVLTIRQKAWWNDIGASVTVRGEIQHPGTYGIQPGERLSAVLKRAGSFLPTAYPQAVVFERVDVRQFQEKGRQALIQRLRAEASSFKASLQQSAQEQAALQQAAFEQRRRAIEALEQTPVSGRMVVRLRSNLAEFEKSPDNVELRNGDSVFIPKRPDFVLVNGQVYSSNAITYKPGKDAGWYLRQAGGPTELSNRKTIFIVRANGSVVSGKGGGWWSGNVLSTHIEPGDMIVVPEKVIGGSSAWKNLLSVAQLAESASIAALVLTR